MTCLKWGLPEEGILTYVAEGHVTTEVPGYCFLVARFKWIDTIWSPKLKSHLRKMVLPPRKAQQYAVSVANQYLCLEGKEELFSE